MIEDLIPIDLPPGFVNTGTTYQSKGRWFTGNFVRFFQKTIQAIGGWSARTTSGATITGTPNCALSWADNAGNNWLAIGTTSHLYVVGAGNVVYDITPATFNNGGQSAFWQLDQFGAYLVAVYNGPGTNPSGAITVFYWAGDTGTLAQPVSAGITDAPYLGFGVVVTPERFLVMLRGSDPATIGTSPTTIQRAAHAGATTGEMVD